MKSIPHSHIILFYDMVFLEHTTQLVLLTTWVFYYGGFFCPFGRQYLYRTLKQSHKKKKKKNLCAEQVRMPNHKKQLTQIHKVFCKHKYTLSIFGFFNNLGCYNLQSITIH